MGEEMSWCVFHAIKKFTMENKETQNNPQQVCECGHDEELHNCIETPDCIECDCKKFVPKSEGETRRKNEYLLYVSRRSEHTKFEGSH